MQVGQQARSLPLGDLRLTIDSAAVMPAGVSSISLDRVMRTIPSRAMRRRAMVTVGLLTPNQSARRALRSGSPSDHM